MSKQNSRTVPHAYNSPARTQQRTPTPQRVQKKSPLKMKMESLFDIDLDSLNSSTTDLVHQYLEPPRAFQSSLLSVHEPPPVVGMEPSFLEEKLKTDFMYVSQQRDTELSTRVELEASKTVLIEKYRKIEKELREEIEENANSFKQQIEEENKKFTRELEEREQQWNQKFQHQETLLAGLSNKANKVTEETRRQLSDKEKEFQRRIIAKDHETRQLLESLDSKWREEREYNDATKASLIQDIKDKHKQEVDEIRDNNFYNGKASKDNFTQKIEKLQEKHTQHNNEVIEAHSKELGKMQHSNSEVIKDLKESHIVEVTELRQKHAQLTNEVNREHAQEILHLQRVIEEQQIKHIKDQSDIHREVNATFDKKEAKTRKAYDKKMRKYEEQLTKALGACDVKRMTMEATLRDAHKEVAAVRSTFIIKEKLLTEELGLKDRRLISMHSKMTHVDDIVEMAEVWRNISKDLASLVIHACSTSCTCPNLPQPVVDPVSKWLKNHPYTPGGSPSKYYGNMANGQSGVTGDHDFYVQPLHAKFDREAAEYNSRKKDSVMISRKLVTKALQRSKQIIERIQAEIIPCLDDDDLVYKS